MQLREPEAFGVFNHHERGVRHIHADLDHGGRHQQLDLAVLKRRIAPSLAGGMRP